MADFNAGSIAATLTLDRDPYTEGLRIARSQADEFESREITAKAKIDNGRALEGLDDLQLRADELNGKDIKLHVEVKGAVEAEAEMLALRASVDGGGGAADAGSSGGGLSGAFSGLSGAAGAFMPTLIGSGILAAPALLGATTGAALGLGGALSIAAAGLIPFGLTAKADFTQMQKDLTALTTAQHNLNTATTNPQRLKAMKELQAANEKLVGPLGVAAKAFQSMQASLAKMEKDTGPAVFGVLGKTFGLIGDLLPKLEPLIDSTAKAVSGVLDQLSKAFNSPGFKKFIDFVSANIGPVLSGLVSSLMGFGGGLATMFEKSTPLINMMVGWLVKMGDQFDRFANSKGFSDFVAYAVQELPIVGGFLEKVTGFLGDLLKGLAPGSNGVIDFFGKLFDALGKIASSKGFQELAGALGDVFTALGPIVTALGPLISDLLPPLAGLLEYVVVPDLQALAGALEGVNGFLSWLTGGSVFADIVLGFAGAAGAVWLFNIAMDANPVGIFIIGIALLVAGIYELVTHFQQVVTFMRGPWGTAILYAMAVVLPFVAIPALIALHWGQVVKFFSTVWNGITSGVSTAYDAVAHFFSKLPGEIKGWFNGAVGWLKSAGSSIVTGLYNGIYGFWIDKVWPWLTGLGRFVKNILSDAGSWLINAGGDVVHGLWNGISGAMGWLKDKITGAASDIVGFFTAGLATHSPSKRMADEVGKWIPWGIAKGIDDNAHAVKQAVDRIVRQTTSANIDMAGSLSLTGSAAITPADRAQLAMLGQVVAQVGLLVNVTKKLPEQTGQHVAGGLKPVLAQQGDRAHQQALQRGRAGAVGYGS